MYVFCEVSIALQKAVAVEVKSGMSQQRQRVHYISWTMLAFEIQANLVKQLYVISCMLFWLVLPQHQPAVTFPKMLFQMECSLHLVTWVPSMSGT